MPFLHLNSPFVSSVCYRPESATIPFIPQKPDFTTLFCLTQLLQVMAFSMMRIDVSATQSGIVRPHLFDQPTYPTTSATNIYKLSVHYHIIQLKSPLVSVAKSNNDRAYNLTPVVSISI